MDWTQVFTILGITIGGFIYLAGRMGKLSDKIDGVKTDLTKEIVRVDEKLTKEIVRVDEKLTKEIRRVDEKLTNKIDGVDKRLSDKIDGVDKRLLRIEYMVEFPGKVVHIKHEPELEEPKEN